MLCRPTSRMATPSYGSVVWFVVLTFAVAAAFVWAAGIECRAQGEAPAKTRAWLVRASILVLAYLAGSLAIAATGWLARFDQRPPPFLLFVTFTTLATTAVAFSPLATRLVHRLGLAGLVGFQVFRVPLEALLYRLRTEGVVPLQMTFEGWNFDIVSGLSAGALGLWALRGRPPHGAVLAWNLLGLALLSVIVGIALLSTPTPLRAFHNEPANTFVAYPPFVWLPGFLVQAAWFGHLLVFRKLAANTRRAA
jgi:hypothetical protein